MNNLSFKANITGINNFETQKAFRERTARDNNHTLSYEGKDKDTGWDIFSLQKNDTTVAKYALLKKQGKNKDFSADLLLKIYNILRLKEALQLIEDSKISKRQKDFDTYMSELDKEDVINNTINE